jgi:hypothetical protein
MPNPMDLIQANFEDWYLRLTKYANGLLKRRVWQGKLGGVPANGEEGQDIVVRVFSKVSSGGRNWDQQKYPDLLPVLYKMVKSEVWNLKVAEANAHIKNPFFDEEGEIHSNVEAVFERLSSNPLTETQLREIEKISGDILTKLFLITENDSDLTKLLELFLDDLKPAEIASRMGKSDQQIVALRKQIDRRLQKIIDEDYSNIVVDEKER